MATAVISGSTNFTSVPVPGGQTVRETADDVPLPADSKSALAYVDLINADATFN